MDELPVQQGSEEQDEDAALVRDDSSWFARQLGQEWESDEPGIYRFVGPAASLSDGVRPTEELLDALAPGERNRPQHDADEDPATQQGEQRTTRR
jgi:hypothetical protein